jgi:hypothetical protein
MKQLLISLLLCLGLLASCGSNPSETPDTLTALRDRMGPSVIGTAYLGSLEAPPEGGILPTLAAEFPDWMTEMDFVAAIADQRILGTRGEIYCIVAKDPDSAVTVNRVTHTDGAFPVAETVYQSQSGEPILILDDQREGTLLAVEVTDSQGHTVIWYPVWEIAECASIENPLWDFGPEIQYDAYQALLDGGWYVPGVLEMAGTLWTSDAGWALELSDEEDFAIRYRMEADGTHLPTHEGRWSMESELLVLELEPLAEGDAIRGSFPVLMGPDGVLWLGPVDDGAAIWLHQAMG